MASGDRPFCPPIRIPVSVGCTITGRSFVGIPPTVGCTSFPEPLRRHHQIRGLHVHHRFKPPHFISAFSTSSCAVLLACGDVIEIPASGSISTNIVRAFST